MSVELKSYSGSGEMGTVSVSDAWAVEVNTDLMQMAVVRQLNNARLGTACTKTRSEIRGGGRKPWKQKGTGRARAGSTRSPVWRGGGTVFGPKPRSFATAMNRKMSAGALASALSTAKDETLVVADQHLAVSKTKDFGALLSKLGVEAGQKVLILSEYSESLFRASRNLPQVSVVNPKNVGVVDVLKHDRILVSASALLVLEGRFSA
ncbi:MAG: 50S ribosomal protein L4 [Candidatus Melainabacteria bacterium HGW-Melainabacteria-1]|nr:ribosomal protein L4 [uncultured bacterium]PKL74527.1 MAG: 50S ribosomal protein L4 [Candidatus Melainabacteria bacterium HGW-Melainabacteria-1]